MKLTSPAFEPFPKIPRLSKPIVVTEKIDGTNGAVVIQSFDEECYCPPEARAFVDVVTEDTEETFVVWAQSRNRIISPSDDNAGFATWVHQNADLLARQLGPGRHFGEWWGVGIQRGYGLRERRFSLFNTKRWSTDWLVDVGLNDIGVWSVPVLGFSGTFSSYFIDDCVRTLRNYGSRAAEGFMNPEGVIVYHTASGQLYKRLIENDDIPKSAA